MFLHGMLSQCIPLVVLKSSVLLYSITILLCILSHLSFFIVILIIKSYSTISTLVFPLLTTYAPRKYFITKHFSMKPSYADRGLALAYMLLHRPEFMTSWIDIVFVQCNYLLFNGNHRYSVLHPSECQDHDKKKYL